MKVATGTLKYQINGESGPNSFLGGWEIFENLIKGDGVLINRRMEMDKFC